MPVCVLYQLLDIKNRSVVRPIQITWIQTWAIYQAVLGVLEDVWLFV